MEGYYTELQLRKVYNAVRRDLLLRLRDHPFKVVALRRGALARLLGILGVVLAGKERARDAWRQAKR